MTKVNSNPNSSYRRGVAAAQRRTYVPTTFRTVRRGAYKNVLAWTDSTGADRREPQFTPDSLFVVCQPLKQPEKPLEAGKWVDVETDGDMFVRDGVVLVSPTAELLMVAAVELGAHLVLPNQHVVSTIRIKPKEKLDSLPPLLYVGVFK